MATLNPKVPQSTQEALQTYADAGPGRTNLFGVYNSTPFPIEIAFGQIKSSYEVSAPFTNNTGVFTFATHANGNQLFDPSQRGWMIIGTEGSASIKINNQDLNKAYPPCAEGNYWSEMTFVVGYNHTATGREFTIETRGKQSPLPRT